MSKALKVVYRLGYAELREGDNVHKLADQRRNGARQQVRCCCLASGALPFKFG